MWKEYQRYLKFKDYKNYLETIKRINNQGLKYMLLTNFVVSLVNLIFRSIMNDPGMMLLLGLVAVNFVFCLAAFALCRNKHLDFTALIYVFMIPCLLFPLISELILHRQPDGMVFLFLLIILPLFPLDLPKRVFSIITIFAILYLLSMIIMGDRSNFLLELMHLLDAYFLSLLVNAYSLSTRIRNVELGEHFEKKSEHDPLTGIYNRDGGVHYITPKGPGALIFIDLDNFKKVNDGYGHAKGDEVLKAVAKTLQRKFRDDDIIMRYGGDEFAVFTRGNWNQFLMEKRLNDLLYDLRKISVSKEGTSPMYMTASIGCLIAKSGCPDLDTMLRLADQEMYEAKEHGKNSYRILLQE